MRFSGVALCAVALSLAACTPDIGGDDYSVVESGEFNEVYRGKITAKRKVIIRNATREEQRRGGGPNAGAGVGAVAGGAGLGLATNSVGGAVGGAVVGGIAGHLIGAELSKQKGFQYTVQLDDGRSISISQGLKPELSVGQKVMVIKGTPATKYAAATRTRVLPDDGAARADAW